MWLQLTISMFNQQWNMYPYYIVHIHFKSLKGQNTLILYNLAFHESAKKYFRFMKRGGLSGEKLCTARKMIIGITYFDAHIISEYFL